MRKCGTGAKVERRSVLFVMMMSLAAAGCGGGGGGGTTANNDGGQSSAPIPQNPFSPPSQAPSPTPTPAEPTPPLAQPPGATPPAVGPGASTGGVMLSWELPTETSIGAPIGTLAGYHINYGRDEKVLSETIIVDNPGVLSYVIDTLPPGRYYFAVRAVSATGDKSSLSNVVSREIG